MLLAVGAAGPLIYLSLSSRAGYGDPLLLAALVAGLLAAVGFVRRERLVDAPLIDLSMLRSPAMGVGLSSGFVSYLALFGTLFVVPYYLTAKHVGFAMIGLQLSVLPVAIGVAAPIAERLLNRARDRPLMIGGMILTGVGLLEIALGRSTGGLSAGLALAGLGLGAFTPPNNATIMAAPPAGHAGVLSGALKMTRGMGTAVGVALASAIYAAAAGASATRTLPAAARGFTAAVAVLGSVALVVGLSLLLNGGRVEVGVSSRRRDRPRTVPSRHRLCEPAHAQPASTSQPGS